MTSSVFIPIVNHVYSPWPHGIKITHTEFSISVSFLVNLRDAIELYANLVGEEHDEPHFLCFIYLNDDGFEILLDPRD